MFESDCRLRLTIPSKKNIDSTTISKIRASLLTDRRKMHLVKAVRRVLIVGGGITGMSLAICLQRAGVATELVELNANWGTYGAGISLTGPGLRAFKVLGVLEKIKSLGFCSEGTKFCDKAGNVIFANPSVRLLGDDIPNSGAIMRPVLHKILSEATLSSGAVVRLGRTVSSFRSEQNGVTARFDDGSVGNYDLLVGADGIYSSIRRQLFPHAPEPQFTGQGCWRSVAQRPPGIDGPHVFLGGRVKVGVNPVSNEEMYMFVLQHVPENPRVLQEDLHIPLAKLISEFGGVIGRVRTQLGSHSRIVYRPLEKLLLASPWYRDRVVLIGDAAHATTPHLASGAAIGVEDAIVLAQSVTTHPSIGDALSEFMRRRFERCKLVVENSALLGELEMKAAPPDSQTLVSRNSAAALAVPF